MSNRPLARITAMTIGLAAVAAGSIAMALALAGRGDWSVGVIAGWLAGSLNAALLARRVSLLTARSTVAGFLYGMTSRFALVGATALLAYRLLDANLVGFAIGLALVVVMAVPVTVLWSLRWEVAR